MKKNIITIFLFIVSLCVNAQNASKIIYSNALTHCYITAVSINDSTVNYYISETSDRKIWRLTERSETQSLGLFDKETTKRIFEEAIKLANEGKIGDSIEVTKNVNLKYVKVWGIKCIQLNNTLVNSSFNINKKTAEGALRALEEN